MGNTQQGLTPNPIGGMAIQTEKPLYLPGETVSGHIYIQLFQSIQGGQLFLKVKGKEDTKWVVVHRHTTGSGRNRRTHTTRTVHMGHLPFLNYRVPVHAWGQMVPAGQYSVPFSLVLPLGLPGSFQENHSSGYGNIMYKLKAEIFSQNGIPQVKGMSPLWIREPVLGQVGPLIGDSNIPIKTWCCCDQGMSHLKCYFEKNAYMPGEIANVYCEIDNSRSSVGINAITCKLMYRIELRSATNSHTYSGILSQLTMPGLGPGQAAVGDQRRVFSLPIVAKKNTQGAFQATTSGKLVKCIYTLEVRCDIDGCTCCDPEPQIDVPISLYFPIPVIAPIQAPANWAPQEIPLVTVQLDQQFQYMSKKTGMLKDGVEETDSPHIGPPNTDAQMQMAMNQQPNPQMAYPAQMQMGQMGMNQSNGMPMTQMGMPMNQMGMNQMGYQQVTSPMSPPQSAGNNNYAPPPPAKI